MNRKGGVMRRVYTLIFVGCVSLNGYAAYAQSSGSSSVGSIFPSLMPGTSSSGVSASGIMDDIMGQTTGTSAPTGQQASAIDEGLLAIEDVVIPEANQIIVEAVDSRTKRYTPRLKINFAEFPLRSWDAPNGRSATSTTQAEIVAQRIQSRLGTSQIALVVQNRIAVVSGTVTSERQRNLAETMLRFEPGIDVVHNKIIVEIP